MWFPTSNWGPLSPSLGFIHRHTQGAEIYFLANTSSEPVSTSADFRVDGLPAQWWDATTGRITAANTSKGPGRSVTVAVELPPLGALFLVFASGVSPGTPEGAKGGGARLDLSRDWDVTFANAASEPNPAPAHFASLASWTGQPETKYFSGVGTYRKDVSVTDSFLAPGLRQMLDFGSGSPAVSTGRAMGVRANFQPPVGDAAVVYVNDRRAGALWCPPYAVDVTGLLKSGVNHIRIEVANRAVNFMADTVHHPLPDYRALNASPELGGNRFQAQDMSRIEIQPSGILGAVQLRSVP